MLRAILDRLFRDVRLDADSRARLREVAERGTLLYVIGTFSFLEFWCWYGLLAREGLPLPHAANGLTRRCEPALLARLLARARSVLWFLRRPPWTLYGKGFFGAYDRAVLDGAREAERPVLAVPLVIRWAPRALRGGAARSWLDGLLGSAEEPGPFRRLAQLLWGRGRARAFIADPVDVSALVRSAAIAALPAEVQARRLRFELSGAFERARRAVLGPRRKTAARLRREVLRGRRMQQAIADAASTLGPERARRRAERHVREIAADMQPWMIQLAAFLLDRVFQRIYDGLEVDGEGMARVREAARRGPLLLVPSHRSHVDYLVLSYVFHKSGVAPPHVAAGANLSFFPLGWMFRRGGAFFLRRTFGGDRLYAAAFREYVRKLLREGHGIEFFIEGGRSRTGKLLAPKLGLLGMVCDLVAAGEAPDVQVVPVSIAYDKVIEDRSYAHEALGGAKRPEDIGAVLRATRVLRASYGRLYLRFDAPFALREWLAGAGGVSDEGARRRAVVRLSHRVLWGINRVTPVTPTALVACALLAPGRRGVARSDLLTHARLLARRIVAADGALAETLRDPSAPGDVPLSIAALDRSLELLEGDGHVRVRGTMKEPFYLVPEDRRVRLEYYRNAGMHDLVADALVAAALLGAGGSADLAGLRDRTRDLSQILKHEFVYRAGVPFETIFAETVERLARDGLIAREGDAARAADRGALCLLAGLVRDYLQSYLVVARGLSEPGGAPARDLVARLRDLGERLYLEGEITRCEAVSRVKVESALFGLRDLGAVAERDGRLVPTSTLPRLCATLASHAAEPGAAGPG